MLDLTNFTDETGSDETRRREQDVAQWLALERPPGRADGAAESFAALTQGTTGDDLFTFTGVPVGGEVMTYDGLAGVDTADFTAITSALTFTLSADLIRVGDIALRNVERLLSGRGADSLDLAAFAGLTLIDGGLGDDVIRGSASTMVRGGGGNDTLSGGRELFGDDGDDRLEWGGQTLIDGGAGIDTLLVTTQVTRIDLGAGTIDGGIIRNVENVVLNIGTSDVSVIGDGAANNFSVVATRDTGVVVTLDGGAGDDVLVGSTRTVNRLFGGDGNDVLTAVATNHSRPQADEFHGGAGNDLVHAVSGPNRYWGDEGIDTISFATGTNEAVDFAFNRIGTRENAIFGFENAIGGPAGSIFRGDYQNNIFIGGQSADNFSGRGGDDRLEGGGGRDILSGGGGSDIILGGDGDDVLLAGTGLDIVDGGAGADTLVLDAVAGWYTVDRTANGYLISHVGGEIRLTNVEHVNFGADRIGMRMVDFEQQAFDPFSYMVANPDVYAVFGAGGSAAARNHYFSQGVLEGRSVGRFDPLAYIAANPDLIQAFGLDAARATVHYMSTGRFEGRTTTFDAARYLASNPDLARQFSDDTEAATRHYIQTGFAAGRPTATFDGLLYSASNPDLAREFSIDALGSTWHYLNGGVLENRPTSGFDSLNYLASNPDLALRFGSNGSAGLQYFLTTGLTENRAVSSFDARIYAATSLDLARFFGADVQAARLHYLNNGVQEGRATTGFDPVAYLLSNSDLRGLTADQALDHWLINGADEGRSGDSLYGREQSDHVLNTSQTAGVLETAADRDWFGQSFAAGERITLQSSAGVALTLYDALGRPVAAVSGQANTYDIGQAGTYYVSVASSGNQGGAYTLTLVRLMTAPAEMTAWAELTGFEDANDAAFARDHFGDSAFDAAAGQWNPHPIWSDHPSVQPSPDDWLH